MDFKLLEFNPRRHSRGVEAARVECIDDEQSCWLWMSAKDVARNIKEFGQHPELIKALDAYKTPHIRFEVSHAY